MSCKSTMRSDAPLTSMKVTSAGSTLRAISAGGGAPENPVTAAFPGARMPGAALCAEASPDARTKPSTIAKAVTIGVATVLARRWSSDIRTLMPWRVMEASEAPAKASPWAAVEAHKRSCPTQDRVCCRAGNTSRRKSLA